MLGSMGIQDTTVYFCCIRPLYFNFPGCQDVPGLWWLWFVVHSSKVFPLFLHNLNHLSDTPRNNFDLFHFLVA